MPSMLHNDDGLTDKQRARTFKFAKPQLPYDAIKKPWCCALVKKRLFIYYREELMPRFVFNRKHSEWVGQGVHLKSIPAIMDWIERQPLKIIQIE